MMGFNSLPPVLRTRKVRIRSKICRATKIIAKASILSKYASLNHLSSLIVRGV
jgi:hypothetical protein